MSEQRSMHEAGPPRSATPLSETEVAAVAEAWLAVSAQGDERAAAAFARSHADRLVTQVGRLWMALRDVAEQPRRTTAPADGWARSPARHCCARRAMALGYRAVPLTGRIAARTPRDTP